MRYYALHAARHLLLSASRVVNVVDVYTRLKTFNNVLPLLVMRKAIDKAKEKLELPVGEPYAVRDITPEFMRDFIDAVRDEIITLTDAFTTMARPVEEGTRGPAPELRRDVAEIIRQAEHIVAQSVSRVGAAGTPIARATQAIYHVLRPRMRKLSKEELQRMSPAERRMYHARDISSQIARIFTTALVPFFNIAVGVAYQGAWRFNPIRFLLTPLAKDDFIPTRRWVELAIGGSMLMLGYAMGRRGDVVLTGETPGERESLYDKNLSPYMFQIPGTNIALPLYWMGALAIPYSMGGAVGLYERRNEQRYGARYPKERSALAVTESVLTSALAALTDSLNRYGFNNALTSVLSSVGRARTQEAMADALSDLLGTFIPLATTMRRVQRLYQPEVLDNEDPSYLRKAMYRLLSSFIWFQPFQKRMARRVTIRGETATQESDLLTFLTGARRVREDEMRAMMDEMGVFPAPPPRTFESPIGTYNLPSEEYELKARYVGRITEYLLRQTLPVLYNMWRTYRDSGDILRAEVVRQELINAIGQAREVGGNLWKGRRMAHMRALMGEWERK